MKVRKLPNRSEKVYGISVIMPMFNEEATITLHVVGDNVYVEVTNSTPFNPYLIGAYLANFYKAQYFSCTVVLR